MCCAKLDQIRPVCFFTDRNDLACTISFCQSDGCNTILDDHTFQKRNIQSSGSFQVHFAFISIGSIIVDNIFFLQPFPDGEAVEVKVNVCLDRSTCQNKGDAALMQALHQLLSTCYEV